MRGLILLIGIGMLGLWLISKGVIPGMKSGEGAMNNLVTNGTSILVNDAKEIFGLIVSTITSIFPGGNK